MDPLQRKVATLTILKKEEMHSVQQENIRAAMVLSNLIKSCVGPRSMVKMILTRIGSMELTNDGNSILREMEVTHPVIKSLVELSRTQSEEVGDGTTSVVILAAEILQECAELLREGMHPTVICSGLKKALEYILERIKKYSVEIGSLKKEKNKTEEQIIREVVRQGVGTKLSKFLIDLENIAISGITLIKTKENGKTVCDIKNNIKIEKIPGGRVEDTEILDGVAVQKDVLDLGMKRRIEGAKVLLIDFPLEYRKGENHMHIEMHKSEVFSRALEVEEEQVEKMVKMIAQAKPSVVVSEKGMCDHAIYLLKKSGISAIRRIKKSENQRISLATGAQIVSRPEDVSAKKLGSAGLFEVVRIGDEEYAKFVKCAAPKACTVILRGPSKDILNELERNLVDAFSVAKNLHSSSLLVRGAGCVEMAISHDLASAQNLTPKEAKIFSAVARALQIIPSTLIANSGTTCSLRKLLELRAHHAQGRNTYGVDGETGQIEPTGILESALVKEQSFKSAIEGSIIILRVDGIVKQE